MTKKTIPIDELRALRDLNKNVTALENLLPALERIAVQGPEHSGHGAISAGCADIALVQARIVRALGAKGGHRAFF